MTLIKNKIPILEYDDNPCAVLMPAHEKLNIHLPEKAVFVFLGECVEAYAHLEKAEKVAEFISITKKYPIRKLLRNGNCHMWNVLHGQRMDFTERHRRWFVTEKKKDVWW